ncbi:hypothetical protein [Vibrio coralliilyticus]|uniref:hypothetical protein n=1 Tax=Vibrio coralliilyticus TaxID=190893 RepID=UPI0020B8509D|nr:hypothetical protein [Vibrio coralliilyticus]
MTDLTPFPPLEHLEPDEFADLVRKAIKRDPQAGAHPAIQSAISHFQDEFVRRQGEWQPATLQRLRNAWNVFVRWCTHQGIPALPARHQDVERYLIERCNELHRNTLKVHLWAIGRRMLFPDYRTRVLIVMSKRKWHKSLIRKCANASALSKPLPFASRIWIA